MIQVPLNVVDFTTTFSIWQKMNMGEKKVEHAKNTTPSNNVQPRAYCISMHEKNHQ